MHGHSRHLKKCAIRPPRIGGGGSWERHHLEKILKGQGYDLWLLLLVYVDDFKLAGPEENLADGWVLISKLVEMSSPKPVDKFLGCIHIECTATLDGKTVRAIEYGMSAYAASRVKLFCECIESVQPGSADLAKPAYIPNQSQYVGGNATPNGSKPYGFRWEHYPEKGH